MSDKDNKEERKLTAYERWELPHLESSDVKETTGPAILVQKNTVMTSEEVDQDSLIYEPLTASQLEEIRAAAYDEGFIQGEEEGHKKGYEGGFSKGEVDGYEKGQADGLAAGIEEGRQLAQEEAKVQFAQVEQLLQAVTAEIAQPLEASRAAVENLLYQTMVRMVENVCLSKMQEDGQAALKEQLVRVFDEIGEYEGRIRIRLNSGDIAVLDAIGVRDRLTIQIEEDDAMVSGGFVLDSKSFHIDGRVEQRLAAVYEELRHLTSVEQD
ncbi:FliH/SctL family protein [Marinomonas sp. TW1]|uniref:FliH/SctL family protein n=1 Tax=Marinomonas sp. TW1 TaxID=1561203 RepID=UPI0007AEFB75|nr:FliH/SctL family protein [Marinomonas sp. TW1]KZN12933.1 flagellar assembly protein FliH [Marinomonas sp. TW1]